MLKVLTPKQMGAADEATIASGTPSLSLMERAGWAVALEAAGLAGGIYGNRFLVLAGRGNNAGDGFVAARQLRKWGGYPTVILTSEPSRLKGDAAKVFSAMTGVRTLHWSPAALAGELGRASVVIDALVGTGFTGALRGPAAEAVEAVEASGAPVLAVDIPSGVDGTTGAVEGPVIDADVTVTMAAPKRGLFLGPGYTRVGHLVIADIGVDVSSQPSEMMLIEDFDVAAVVPQRSPDAHKRSVGTVLVVAGSAGMSGAAAMAAAAALRTGAGLVTMAVPASIATETDGMVPEATTLALAETPDGTIEAAAAAQVLDAAERVDAVALGPGLGRHPETQGFVRKVVPEIGVPLLIDADGLNLLAGELSLVARRDAPTVLTPHPGEIGRLVDLTTAEVQGDRMAAVTTCADEAGAAVLLKGYRTLVAAPEEPVAVIARGTSALATGGSGDVLTGIIAALLAGGVEASPAAWSGAFLHAVAGELAEERSGPQGVLATDLLGDIPDAMAAIGHT